MFVDRRISLNKCTKIADNKSKIYQGGGKNNG